VELLARHRWDNFSNHRQLRSCRRDGARHLRFRPQDGAPQPPATQVDWSRCGRKHGKGRIGIEAIIRPAAPRG
jgi:hypothetical protein